MRTWHIVRQLVLQRNRYIARSPTARRKSCLPLACSSHTIASSPLGPLVPLPDSLFCCVLAFRFFGSCAVSISCLFTTSVIFKNSWENLSISLFFFGLGLGVGVWFLGLFCFLTTLIGIRSEGSITCSDFVVAVLVSCFPLWCLACENPVLIPWHL